MKLQKKALRIITLTTNVSDAEPFYKNLSLSKVDDILKLQQFKFHYKCSSTIGGGRTIAGGSTIAGGMTIAGSSTIAGGFVASIAKGIPVGWLYVNPLHPSTNRTAHDTH